MSHFDITYLFKLSDTSEKVFSLTLDESTLDLVNTPEVEMPFWAELDYHKCPHCPLPSKTIPHCPLTASLVPVVQEFQAILSYQSTYLQVITKERIVSQETTAQRALGSFIGIIMACSGCPHTEFFKPMARFHLPLSSEEETIYRSTSMYLLAQYFRHQENNEVDFSLDGLDQIYTHLQTVNAYLVNRLRNASKADSYVNAIIMLDMFAQLLPYVIEDSLEEIRHLFSPFLKNPQQSE